MQKFTKYVHCGKLPMIKVTFMIENPGHLFSITKWFFFIFHFSLVAFFLMGTTAYAVVIFFSNGVG